MFRLTRAAVMALGSSCCQGLSSECSYPSCQIGSWTLARVAGISTRVQSVLIFSAPTVPCVMGTSLPNLGFCLCPD